MKNSSKSVRRAKDEEVLKKKRKLRKRRRDLSDFSSSTDSDNVKGGRKRKRENGGRKRVYDSSSDNESVDRQKKKKKRLVKSSEEKKKSSKRRKIKSTKKNGRGKREPRRSPSSSYSSSVSCSTCRDLSSSGGSECENFKRSRICESEREVKKVRFMDDKGNGKNKNLYPEGKRLVGTASTVDSSQVESAHFIDESAQDLENPIHRMNVQYDLIDNSAYESNLSGEINGIKEDERWEMGFQEADVKLDDPVMRLRLPVNSESRGDHKIEVKSSITNVETGRPFGNENVLDTVSNNRAVKNDAASTLSGSGDNALEILLRQRALENLRKFHTHDQDKSKTKEIPSGDSARDHKKEEVYATGSFPNRRTSNVLDEGCLGVTSPSNVGNPAILVEDQRRPHGRKETSSSTLPEKSVFSRLSNAEVPKKSRSAPLALTSELSSCSGLSSEDVKTSIAKDHLNPPVNGGNKHVISKHNDNTELVPDSKRASINTTGHVREFKNGETIDDIQAPSVTSESNVALDVDHTEAGPSVSNVVACSDQKIDKPLTSDSSQFEQRTMSVMRGGELVQVSYKVYIPKKAPALARRQLKR